MSSSPPPTLVARAASPPFQDGPVQIDDVEVYRSHVRVLWRSTRGAVPIAPDADEYVYCPIALSDDQGTDYFLETAHASFEPEVRGVCIYTPGPPVGARVLEVVCAGVAVQVGVRHEA